MATRSYTSRRELEEYHFSPWVTLLAPLLLLFLQAVLPRLFPRLLVWSVLPDLPLIAVIFFSVARRSPVAGSITGAAIGLVGVHAYHTLWLHELARAGLNTALAIPLFYLLDRFKLRD